MGVTELALEWVKAAAAEWDGDAVGMIDFLEQFLDTEGGTGGEVTEEAKEWVGDRLVMAGLAPDGELFDAVMGDVDFVIIQLWAFKRTLSLELRAKEQRANCG